MLKDYNLDGWNHRLIHHKEPHPLRKTNLKTVPKYMEYYAIHEVYYDSEGNPVSCTKEPVNVLDNNIEDIKWALEKMLEALNKPILEYEQFLKQEK